MSNDSLRFEWDQRKAAANLRRHGVSFEAAVAAFRDPFAVEWIDTRAAYGEERVVLLGTQGAHMLTIVYTERGATIRIISARKATRYEQEQYYRQNAP
jgi:uncharacterized protein